MDSVVYTGALYIVGMPQQNTKVCAKRKLVLIKIEHNIRPR